MSYRNFEKAIDLIDVNKKFLKKIYPQKEETIMLAEKELGVKLPPSYREFLKKYGVLDFRTMDIYGIWKETFDGGCFDIVQNTLENLREYNTFHHYIIIYNVDSFYCVLDTSEVNTDGECTVKGGYGLFLPDENIEIEEKYEDFGDFLLNYVQKQIKYSEEKEWLEEQQK